MTFLVIRVRSDRGVKPKIRDTMSMLNLSRVNHAVLIPETPAYAGMLLLGILTASRGVLAGARARLRGVQAYRGRLITTWSTWKVCKHTMLSS